LNDLPLVPGPLYGLRTWRVVGDAGRERLAGPHRGVTWPAGGGWLEATCPVGHGSPAGDCDCGVHAWHPRRQWARRIVAARREVPGIVEASGTIEVHDDGFRAQRGRPYALVLDARRNPALVRRLAFAYGVPVVEYGGPTALLDWCRAHELGLDEAVVGELLGRRKARHARANAARTAAALALVALMVLLGLLATDSPGERTLYGRTGWVHVHR
jgi:hypothetical protein